MKEFYWYGNTKEKNKLKDNLLELEEIKEIQIATAYFSREGIKILKEFKEKYNLNKEKISLYLASDFSMENPGDILKQLKEICKTNIVFDIKFHPKVYWIKSKNENRIMFGSSNLTKGGFENNIEFDIIKTTKKYEDVKVDLFFKFCKSNSKEVSKDIIEYYEKYNEEIKKLKNTMDKINGKLNGYIRQKDAFEEIEYELGDMYFTYKDYETLFERNQKLDNSQIKKRREIIQEKLLKIHEKIYNEIQKENLNCHWNEKNITSQIDLTMYNKHCVNWIGVRYGKTKDEVTMLRGKKGLGFQKHACLQFVLTPFGFEINLFHAVKHDAIDRNYLYREIERKKKEIVEEIEKLKGKNLVWKIYDEDEKEEYNFEFDYREAKEFIDFYKEYDKDGRESQIIYFLEPNDKRLKDIDTISEVVKEKIKLLNPLYKLLAWRSK